MLLNTLTYDGPETVPLVIAHGLFGSARNWNVIAKRLSDSRPVMAVDMRNHGDSPHDTDNSYAALAGDLADVIDSLGGRADVLGHSMGGKAAMMLALQTPALLRHLIIADIAPVRYGHSQISVINAMRAVDLTQVTRRSDADTQLAAHIAEPALRAFLLQSLIIGDGPARWKLALEVLADQMPEIIGFPDISHTSDTPAVFLRGGASDYVDGASADAALALFPKGRVETMPGLGHWLHAEDPRGFEAAIRAALDESPSP